MADFKLKLVSGGLTYYVTTLQQTSLNMNAVPPFINTGSLTGLTLDADLATAFNDAQVKEAKMAYPAFVAEPYVAPVNVGLVVSSDIWITEISNGATIVREASVSAQFVVGATVNVFIENPPDPAEASIQISNNPAGPFDVVTSLPVVGGEVSAPIYFRYSAIAGTAFAKADVVLKNLAGVTIFTANVTGYHLP